jgi:hypothetical protein
MRIVDDHKNTKPSTRRRRVRKSECFLEKPEKEISDTRKVSIFVDRETERMIEELRRYGARDAVIAKAIKFLYDKDQAALRIAEAIIIS